MPGTISVKSRGELESQIGRAFVHFEKEYMGRGPLETRTYLLDDLVLIRLYGVLTPAERKLSESQRERGAYLLKQVRNELLCSGRSMLEVVIRDIVGVGVQSIHTDISTKTGERIVVITLLEKPHLRDEGDQGENGCCLKGESSSITDTGGDRRNGVVRR